MHYRFTECVLFEKIKVIHLFKVLKVYIMRFFNQKLI